MQRLEGLDTSFIYLDSPEAPMHVAMTCIFDPGAAPGGFSFDDVRERIAARLHLVPPFRRRLVPLPGHVHRPVWVDDPDFDLERHLYHAKLPTPGGPAELEHFTAEVVGRPLDRTRPLWEMHLVDGLEDGMVAVVTKMHHATIDGVSAAELAVNLLDQEPDAPTTPVPAPVWSPGRVPSWFRLLRDAAFDLARQPIVAATTVARTAGAPLRLRSYRRDPGTVDAPGLFGAPRTCANTTLTERRHVGFADVSLDDVKWIKNATCTTVNDVVLSLCAGVLRDHLREHDALPDRSLVAAVPVSVRGAEQGVVNRLSAMLVDLATNLDDPVVRLAATAINARAAKEQHDRLGHQTLSRLAGLTPPAVLGLIATIQSRLNAMGRAPAVCNVIISNFAGPSFPLYMAGARMLAAYPVGPLGVGTGLNITVQSYLDTLWFSIVSCPDTVPAPHELPGRLTDALRDLTKSVLARTTAVAGSTPAT